MEQTNFKRLKIEDDREYIFDYKAFKREVKRVAVAAKKSGDVSSIEMSNVKTFCSCIVGNG